jgi:hypothetical protein
VAKLLKWQHILRICSLTSANPDNKTPYEKFFGRKPDVTSLKRFGSIIYIKNESPSIKKGDDRAFKAIFLGFDDQTKGYVAYDIKNDVIKISRNISFAEHLEVPPIDSSINPKKESNEISIIQNSNIIPIQTPISPMINSNTSSSSTTSTNIITPTITPDLTNHDNIDTSVSNGSKQVVMESDSSTKDTSRKSNRERISKGSKDNDMEYGDWWNKIQLDEANIAHNMDHSYISNTGIFTPSNYFEAEKFPEWKEAMNNEYSSLLQNGTWELTTLPKGRSPIGCKWVFKAKQDANGNISKYKARLVAKGYTQKEGIDFTQTYSPTASKSTIRLLISVAALKGYSISQLDISNAYLHADIDEEIFMVQPEGFTQLSKNGEKLVCRLKKSLYGLKQSARNWNSLLDKWFKSNGFTQSIVDPCLYVYNHDGIYMALAVYVDDIIMITNNEDFRAKAHC